MFHAFHISNIPSFHCIFSAPLRVFLVSTSHLQLLRERHSGYFKPHTTIDTNCLSSAANIVMPPKLRPTTGGKRVNAAGRVLDVNGQVIALTPAERRKQEKQAAKDSTGGNAPKKDLKRKAERKKGTKVPDEARVQKPHRYRPGSKSQLKACQAPGRLST